jgi:hypothetical protein
VSKAGVEHQYSGIGVCEGLAIAATASWWLIHKVMSLFMVYAFRGLMKTEFGQNALIDVC